MRETHIVMQQKLKIIICILFTPVLLAMHSDNKRTLINATRDAQTNESLSWFALTSVASSEFTTWNPPLPLAVEKKEPSKSIFVGDFENSYCPICKRSYTSDYFKKHMALHNGASKHTCEECEQSFIRKGQLRKHIRHFHTELKK